MKTRTIIEEFSHEDLVDLLCTATYGSEYFACRIPKGNYKGTDLENENDCTEDKWAKVLLAGKTLYVYDYYAEDETDFFGNLPHKWKEDEQAMRYTITLEDIKKGAQQVLDSKNNYDKKCMQDWMAGEGDMDLCEAENLLQLFVFGEAIYG
jgi:hypothetical protein